jgi:FkbM family methyltransferase
MYQSYRWTPIAADRLSILKKYEPIQPYILLELARTVGTDTFIDVGANIGVYSVFMSSLECVRSVHAFEPSPQTFNELSHIVKLNAIEKIKTYRIALSDVSQSAKFGIVSDYSGANSLVDGSIHDEEKFIREEAVDCVPLDSIGIETSGTLCVKIDVEGHEKRVLLGAEAALTRNQAIIQMERYEKNVCVSEILLRYGYRRLCVVGPDCYYTNISRLTCDDVITVFEKASHTLIASNFEARENHGGPLKVRLLPGVNVEVSGIISSFARRAKQRIQSR